MSNKIELKAELNHPNFTPGVQYKYGITEWGNYRVTDDAGHLRYLDPSTVPDKFIVHTEEPKKQEEAMSQETMSDKRCVCLGWRGTMFTEGKEYSYEGAWEPNGRFKVMDDRGVVRSVECNRFRTIEKQEVVMDTQASSESYEFKVQNKSQVDSSEVYEELTRERPLAIVHTSDGYVGIFIHDSVWDKALLMPKEVSKELEDAYKDTQDPDWSVDFMPLDSAKINRLTKAIKAVRNGRLKKKHRGNLSIRVDIIAI